MTWNHYKSGTEWDTPGGDFGAQGVSWNLPISSDPGYVDINITSFANDALNNRSDQLKVAEDKWALSGRELKSKCIIDLDFS